MSDTTSTNERVLREGGESQTEPADPGVPITIDGRQVMAKPGELVISAAERNGIYIPRFCYHPRMEPVGMCRMCLVEVEGPRGASLQVSCMINVTPDMVVHTESPVVKKAQDGVLEFLLINHPLDCPVCDKGGECPLQDQTFLYGPGESRFVEEKRHYAKPIPISDLVDLDRERCILCDRCTRFAKDVAGDALIHFIERGNQTQVLTFPDEPFKSYFSGNTVQICPVGALLARPYRFKARPWDLEQQESTCMLCSVGCRMTLQSSRNELVRFQGSDVDEVNWGWLCDKGRFSFEAVHHSERLRNPLVRQGDGLVEASWTEAFEVAASAIKGALDRGGPSSVALIGGARSTNEDCYAWAKLVKGVLGTDNVDAQLADGLPAELVQALPLATINEACEAETIVLLGPDLKEELPVLYLRVRDAAEQRGRRIVELSPTATGLTRSATASLRFRPGEEAALVRALLGNGDPAAVGVPREELERVRAWFTPEQAAKTVVILGRSSVAAGTGPVAEAATLLADALPGIRFLPVLRRGNVRGALDMGLAPGMLPGRTTLADASASFREAWGAVPAATGMGAAEILEAAAAGRIGCLILLGADPLGDVPDRDLVQRALAGAGSIVSVDCFVHDSNRNADVVLAAAAYGEKSGTTTNIEGRVSSVVQKVTPPGTARPDWMIAAELAWRLGADLELESVEAIWEEIRRLCPSHAALTRPRIAQGAGVVAAPGTVRLASPAARSEVAPLDAYSLRLVSGRKLYDQGVTVQRSRSLAPLAPGAALRMHPLDFERLGIASGASVRVTSARGEVVAPAIPDPGVPRGSVALAFNQAGVRAGDLIQLGAPVTDVRVETL